MKTELASSQAETASQYARMCACVVSLCCDRQGQLAEWLWMSQCNLGALNPLLLTATKSQLDLPNNHFQVILVGIEAWRYLVLPHDWKTVSQVGDPYLASLRPFGIGTSSFPSLPPALKNELVWRHRKSCYWYKFWVSKGYFLKFGWKVSGQRTLGKAVCVWPSTWEVLIMAFVNSEGEETWAWEVPCGAVEWPLQGWSLAASLSFTVYLWSQALCFICLGCVCVCVYTHNTKTTFWRWKLLFKSFPFEEFLCVCKISSLV